MFRFLILFSICGFAFSKPVDLRFNNIKLNDFLKFAYTDILKSSFVISPELQTQSKTVSLNVSIDDSELSSFLKDFLFQMNIGVNKKGSVYYLFPGNVSSDSMPDNLPGLPGLPNLPFPLPPPVPVGSNSQSFIGSPLPFLDESLEFYKPLNRSPIYICEIVNSLYSNSCTVSGVNVIFKTSSYPEIKNILSNIDLRLPRVQINAVFFEVGNSSSDSLGFNLLASALGGSLSLNTGDVKNGVFSLKGRNFSLILDALKADTRFNEISSPSGLINSGNQFSINIGNDVPTLDQVNMDNNGNAQQSVVYRSSGVILNITPYVIKQGDTYLIESKIDGQVSSFSPTSNGVNSSPTLSKRQVNTILTMSDGEILVMGGLTGSKNSNASSKLFGFIPWGYGRSEVRTELILLISTRVIND